MNIIESIINYFKQKKEPNVVPEGYCPNCWGHQEYEGKFLQVMEENKIDLNNINEKKGWIQEYAVKNFEGIRLKKTDDYFECPSCKLTYRPT